MANRLATACRVVAVVGQTGWSNRAEGENDMEPKEIMVKVVVDTSQFEVGIQKVIDKLNELQKRTEVTLMVNALTATWPERSANEFLLERLKAYGVIT